MVSKRMRFVVLLTLFIAANAPAENARIIGVHGRVTIDGKAAKIGDPVPEGAKVETQSGGSATIAVGEEDVMKVSSDSTLQLQPSADGGKQLNVVLEKGRVEGVRKVGDILGSTKIATESGTMEVGGGRYLIEKSAGKETVFLAVDGGAQLKSNSSAVIGGGSGAIPLNKGDYISLQPVSVNTENKNVMAVAERVVMTPDQATAARIPVPENTQRQPASVPPPVAPPTFRDALPLTVSPINQDPTQPIVPRDPRVKVIFRQ